MIDTGITGTKGSDTVASSVAEAYTLAHAQCDAAERQMSPQGSSPGEEIIPAGLTSYPQT